MWLSTFFTNDWAQDAVATVLTFAVALGWLRLMDTLAARGVIGQADSRKLIHIGTGPIFVLCWTLFSPQSAARYLAALVPLAITAQFVLVGAGVIRDPAAVQAMSRTGDRREILRGPLYYGIVCRCTLVFWRVSDWHPGADVDVWRDERPIWWDGGGARRSCRSTARSPGARRRPDRRFPRLCLPGPVQSMGVFDPALTTRRGMEDRHCSPPRWSGAPLRDVIT
jgi:hypothetical protein